MTTIQVDRSVVVDERAASWLLLADPGLGELWRSCVDAAARGPGPMGLAHGDRPAADVEVLAGAAAAVECALAAAMHAAESAGCLPIVGPGSLLTARGWSVPSARRLARCGALAANHPSVFAAWSAGVITVEHVDAIARLAARFTAEELEAVVTSIGPHWGRWAPASVARFVREADRLLHPPPDPTREEADAHSARGLSFSILGESVLVSGELPRVEGELVMAAIDAFAERLRSTADHVPACARRADALVELVNAASAAGTLPSRGGLPVAVTVTVDRTAAGDAVWSTSRGHLLTGAEARWAGCDALVTPVLVQRGPTVGPEGRLAALAEAMFGTRIPLAVGRSERTATQSQRRALAVRDRGCVIPGCAVPAEACQAHHLVAWAEGGATDVEAMVLLCWSHHRQVDLDMWRIAPADPGGTLVQPPDPGAPPGTPWPANNGAPFVIRRMPRTRWRT